MQKPFKKISVNKNVFFLLSLLGLTAMTVFIVISDNEWIAEKFEVVWETEDGDLVKIPSRSESNFRYL